MEVRLLGEENQSAQPTRSPGYSGVGKSWWEEEWLGRGKQRWREGGIDRSPEGQGRVVDTARVVVWAPANMLLGLHSLFKVKSPSLGI